MRKKIPQRPPKKVVLFLVEGFSDERTFGTLIPAIYEKIFGESIEVEFAIIDGEIREEKLLMKLKSCLFYSFQSCSYGEKREIFPVFLHNFKL